MGYVGWSDVADLANTETGVASEVVAQVTTGLTTGLGVGGSGVVVTYSGVVPATGFAVLPSAGTPTYNVPLVVLDSAGTSYVVSSTVKDSAGTSYNPI